MSRSSKRTHSSGSRPAVGDRRASLAAPALALTILAIALRAWRLNHGLPDFTEEAFVFRKALEMWPSAGGPLDLNPHSFVYPSLTIYLHLAVQHLVYAAGPLSGPADFLLHMLTDPSAAVIAARCIGVAADVATLIAVGRIGQRFGSTASLVGMGIVALAPAMISTSRLLLSDSVMCALATLAVHRLLVYAEEGGRRQLIFAGVLVGLATGAKYPAVLLLLPLALVVWQRKGLQVAVSDLAVAVASAAVAFVLTTPYLLVSGSEFARDAVFLRDVTGGGGLGKLGGSGFAYYLGQFSRNVGWLGCVAFAGALFIAARRGDRRLLLLMSAWLALFIPAAASSVEAERYLVPVVALGAALVGAGGEALVRFLPPLGSSWWRATIVLGVLGPVGYHGVPVAASGKSTTQMEARKWCERHLRDDELLLSEVNGPSLLTFNRKAQVEATALFRAASPSAQAAYRARRPFHLVHLPLIVAGHTSVRLPGPGSAEVQVYPHVVDWNAAAYDVRLLAGVDLVATSAAVRGRFEADTARFAEQARFYRLLDDFCDRMAMFESGHGVDGPAIVIYRMTDRARTEVERAGALDTLWWARTVPEEYRSAAAGTLADERIRSDDAVPGLPAYVQPLRTAYAERYRFAANDLAENLASLDRLAPSERLAAAGLTVLPEDLWALEVYVLVASRLEHWAGVERRLAESIRALARHGPVPAHLLLQHGDVLVRLGDVTRATEIYRSLLRGGDPDAMRAARGRLVRLSEPKP